MAEDGGSSPSCHAVGVAPFSLNVVCGAFSQSKPHLAASSSATVCPRLFGRVPRRLRREREGAYHGGAFPRNGIYLNRSAMQLYERVHAGPNAPAASLGSLMQRGALDAASGGLCGRRGWGCALKNQREPVGSPGTCLPLRGNGHPLVRLGPRLTNIGPRAYVSSLNVARRPCATACRPPPIACRCLLPAWAAAAFFIPT